MSTNPQSDQAGRVVWHQGSWHLEAESVTLPDGTVVERAYVNHPGAVVLVPLLGNTVLMLAQYRLPFKRTMLELPAGTRLSDESWLACAQRELREETGYRAARFTPLGEILPILSYSNEVLAIYLAEELTPDPLPMDADEQIEIRPMSLMKLIDMAHNGDLQDAKSIVAILRAARHLNAF
ncbi:MAG: NUDIX hydrolase [Anaerolineae bacterium]|nr:NUDIX hydrolase [Anaerolineae bacterium]